MRRSRTQQPVGPLAGVPVTVKVNIDQQGFATTNGAQAAARSRSPPATARWSTICARPGAVILGRTNCPAFSYRWFTTNLIHGDTKNPRDPGITPGGSSGGAGAAVAAGIGHIAHGTDIAGSIRYPAYACGVHGLRPTRRPDRGLQCLAARAPDRAADLGGIGPAGAHHRRSQARAGGDVGHRPARSLVGAGAARGPPDAEAGGTVFSSRRAGGRRPK